MVKILQNKNSEAYAEMIEEGGFARLLHEIQMLQSVGMCQAFANDEWAAFIKKMDVIPL